MAKKTKTPTKKIIREMVDDVSPYELTGTLKQLADQIQGYIDQHGPEARLDWNKYHYHDYDNEASPRFEIYRDREETDEEYDRRTIKENIDKQMIEAREREEFERLQKKFGVK